MQIIETYHDPTHDPTCNWTSGPQALAAVFCRSLAALALNPVLESHLGPTGRSKVLSQWRSGTPGGLDCHQSWTVISQKSPPKFHNHRQTRRKWLFNTFHSPEPPALTHIFPIPSHSVLPFTSIALLQPLTVRRAVCHRSRQERFRRTGLQAADPVGQ